MSKNPSQKNKNQQRVPNKNRRPMNNGAKDKALKVWQYVDSRASVRQRAAQRRSNFQGNGFPFAAETINLFFQVCRDPRWGRCYESYSEDPMVVQSKTEIIPGLQGDIPANSPKGVPFVAGK